MAWYICGRCGGDTPYLTSNKCNPCLLVLEGIKPGDTVHWRQGKGWSKGSFVRRYYVDSYVVRTKTGREVVRKDLRLPAEMISG